MSEWLERTILRWLQAVAPTGWSDSVLGDLREDAERMPDVRARRRWTLVHLVLIAFRFTLESLLQYRPALHPSRNRTHRGSPIFVTEIRHAFRALLGSPGFTLVAMLTLALAIGANTAIYSALESLVLHPLPFKEGERFVFVWHRNPQMGGLLLTPSQKAVDRWRELTHIFEAIESFGGESLVVTDGGEPEEISVSLIQPSTLTTLGVRPALGRPIVEADTAAGAPPVALISHALWVRRFGADPQAAGKTITMSGTPYTIIGVMPRRFELPLGSDAVWVAARRDRLGEDGQSTIAKLRPGVTIEEAQRALSAMGAASSDDDLEGWSGQLMAPGDYNGTHIKVALLVLAGAVGLLLLIACVNVANLVLSRNSVRRRELAVRHALGASRRQLARHLLAESSVIAAGGGLGGLVVAQWCIASMAALRPRNLEILDHVYLDGAALAFAAAVSVLTAVLFGVAPAVTASRISLQDVLKTGGWTASASSLRVRRILAGAQIAIALVLLVGASLLLRSYARLTAVHPGFDPQGVLSVRISLPADRYPAKDKARRQAFFDEVLASVRSLPGVTAAAVGSGVPTDTGIMFGTLAIDGRPADARRAVFTGGYVSPSYFATLRIPIVEGRAFTDEDTVGREVVAIIGRSFAEQQWPGRSPLGARIRIESVSEWATVVGVAAGVSGIGRSSATDRLQVYFARAQSRPGFGAIVVRTAGDPAALIPAIKARVWTIDSKLPLSDIATADQLMARTTSQARFNLALLLSFAGCGLGLAMVGVYGVMSLFVGLRQRELGIRMALGASTAAVASLVFRQSAAVLFYGVAIGAAGAAMLSGLLQKLLFETPPRDTASFVVASAAIVVAASAATVIPLRRATKVDPAIVLRGD